MKTPVLDKLFVLIIKFYRISSCWKRPCCRYVPTCSAYALEAIRKYGALKGGCLALKRILRCRPGLKKYENCGYDPVP